MKPKEDLQWRRHNIKESRHNSLAKAKSSFVVHGQVPGGQWAKAEPGPRSFFCPLQQKAVRQARLPFHQPPPYVGPEDAPGEAWAQGEREDCNKSPCCSRATCGHGWAQGPAGTSTSWIIPSGSRERERSEKRGF